MQTFRTSEAAKYLTQAGLSTSVSFLQKLRLRGPDDPRDHGPDFFRDNKICWYSESALNEYLGRRIAARQFRAPARQPLQLRRSEAA
jgi:hypothetical protein